MFIVCIVSCEYLIRCLLERKIFKKKIVSGCFFKNMGSGLWHNRNVPTVRQRFMELKSICNEFRVFVRVFNYSSESGVMYTNKFIRRLIARCRQLWVRLSACTRRATFKTSCNNKSVYEFCLLNECELSVVFHFV